MTRAPVSSLTELLISVLERGFVLAVRLDGPPGDRRLLFGLGLADAADPLLMALCASGAFGTRRRWGPTPVYDDSERFHADAADHEAADIDPVGLDDEFDWGG